MAVSIPAAGFLVRLFMIQHGCGHGSLFRQRWLNNWVGRVVGDFTLTPYSHWRHSHNIHHASSGNLERRGIGDITTLTVSEYCQSTRWQRLGYRLYRNPAVMFGIGPALPLPGSGQAAGPVALVHRQHRHPSCASPVQWQPVLPADKCSARHPELGEVGQLALMQSLRCVPLALWDEEQRRLISFRELARRGNASA